LPAEQGGRREFLAGQEQITHWHQLVSLPLDQVAAEVARESLYLGAMEAQEDSPQAVEEVVEQPKLGLLLVLAEQVEQEWQQSQPIFKMIERYVILNEDGGWLENTILWDGDTETWQPPEGTIAKLESEINYATLPEKPEEQ
jgi:hypothetical protein